MCDDARVEQIDANMTGAGIRSRCHRANQLRQAGIRALEIRSRAAPALQTRYIALRKRPVNAPRRFAGNAGVPFLMSGAIAQSSTSSKSIRLMRAGK